jgi:hypothetical protein
VGPYATMTMCNVCGTTAELEPQEGEIKLPDGWRQLPYERNPEGDHPRFVPLDIPIQPWHRTFVPVCPNFGTDGCRHEMRKNYAAWLSYHKTQNELRARRDRELGLVVKIYNTSDVREVE